MENKFNSCKILDDDEIEDSKNRITNFRRFEVEELQRKFSPFEKTSNQKKEFPFLFQKKKPRVVLYEDKMISIDELMGKVETIKLDENKSAIIEEPRDELKESVSHTPEWPKMEEEFEAINQEFIEHYTNLKKSDKDIREDAGESK